MKKIYLLILMAAGMMQAQIVDIPDAGFKNYLLTANCIDSDNNGTYDTDADLDNDGEVQETEAASAYRLTITGAAILDVQGINSFINITALSMANTSVTEAQVSNMLVMTNMQITANTSLLSLNIIDCTALTSFVCLNNSQLSDLDLTGSHSITTFDIKQNHFQTLDLSQAFSISSLAVKDANLEVLVVKNGHTESPSNFSTMSATDIPNLSYVCADESEMPSFQAAINLIMTNDTLPDFNSWPVVGSYCSFVPEGNYNTIQGNITYDIDDNGCDDNDPDQGLIKLNIINGTNQYAVFTYPDGNYADYFGQGTFDIAPALENESIFTVTPPQANIVFPDANNNIFSQNFCITANGIHPDLEIVIAPIVPARPGFNAIYRIVYKNKGNQAMSLSNGISLQYNDDVLDFTEASEAVSMQNTNSLNWDYQNLLPFESRSIVVTFHVNAPTDTPAVNIGDLLHFTVGISPNNNDEDVDDNTFTYTQTVVGSFDPNDITCLEGDIVSTDEIGNYLHYIINFENTGTYPAENIVVKLQIDPAKFDISSLRIMNASHLLDARVHGSIAELIFQNIQLETGGHGNILLKIRSDEDLVTGDAVTKSANIFFDYNFPIGTNIATTIFSVLSTGDTIKDNSVSIYPNPASDFVNVDSLSEIKSLELFDIQGRLLLVRTNADVKTTVDVSKYTAGTYFIRITTEKGIKTEKVIIK